MTGSAIAKSLREQPEKWKMEGGRFGVTLKHESGVSLYSDFWWHVESPVKRCLGWVGWWQVRQATAIWIDNHLADMIGVKLEPTHTATP